MTARQDALQALSDELENLAADVDNIPTIGRDTIPYLGGETADEYGLDSLESELGDIESQLDDIIYEVNRVKETLTNAINSLDDARNAVLEFDVEITVRIEADSASIAESRVADAVGRIEGFVSVENISVEDAE
jgi:hypothetical protein